MKLLLRKVVVIAILVVSTTATPPPGYVKQPDNDKNPPSYRYKYEIQDSAGDGQGKSEAREGEHASGRYYVNSKRASTDVKYIVDEWGYHPLVKYDSSDDHSSASASFAIGEKAVDHLQNENNGQATSDFLKIGDRRKLIQVIQPYKKLQQNSEENSGALSNLDISKVNSLPANTLNVNYIANTPQQQLLGSISSTTNGAFLTDHQSSIIEQQSNLVTSLGNDLTSTVSDENQLFVNNAGSFGQRLHVQADDASAYSTTTANPISTISQISSTSSSNSGSTRGGRYFIGRPRQKNSKLYLPDTIPGLSAYSSTALPPLDNSVTTNSIENNISHSQEQDNNGIVESSSGSQVYSGSTTPSPLLINYASHGILLSSKTTDLTTAYENKDSIFSKPIVVPDVQKDEKPFQYSTTFECEDDGSSVTPDPLALIKDSFRDTTSSHILNPIQAGVALVNAGETHLIDNSASADEPAPVNEDVEDIPQADQASIQLTNSIVQQSTNYVGVNPAFGDQNDVTESPQIKQESQGVTDQTVEIQKSIEIYQNSPGQKIQYSEEPMQVSQVMQNNQQNENLENQQQQIPTQYFTSSAELQAKKAGGSRTRSETQTKVYGVSDNYSKDSADDKPIYVVPPATYIIEDSSILKNSLLQEKVRQYQTEITGTDSQIRSNDQQIQLEIQNDGNQQQQSYQPSIDSGISYETEINQNQQHIAIQPETIIEKTIHVPQIHPVEKIIEKKVPYPVEKIVEKKIPIPQPYPVPVEVPIPQPFPIHIEKVIERKVPIPVHIPFPQPYPVEKQVHIPIPIEKIVEKPVHIPIPVEKIVEKKIPVPQPYPVEIEKIIERKVPYPVEVTKYIEKPVTSHAPYGVQYGLSYQQIMKPQNHGLYSGLQNSITPLYALSVSANNNNNLYSASNSIINKKLNEINVNSQNHSQPFQGYVYEKPAIPFIEGKENIDNNQFLNSKLASKKIAFNSYSSYNYPLSNTLLHRRHTSSVHRPIKYERDDYFGPVPPFHHIQRQYGFQSKAFGSYPSIVDRSQGVRKSRTFEPQRHQKGSFRQSKIEYGFKPPMVPSVQYDEETASKVES